MQIYEILVVYANLPFIFNTQTTALSFRISIRRNDDALYLQRRGRGMWLLSHDTASRS